MNLQQLANQAGLDLVGAVPVGTAQHWSRYREWIAQGYSAGMSYLSRPDAMFKRQDPRHIFPQTRTVLVVASSYRWGMVPQPGQFEGIVSRYAWGKDYHTWLLGRLQSLVTAISHQVGRSINARCYVDTGPILERSWALNAGLGWIGKNTCLINPGFGSHLFLGVSLLDYDLGSTVSQTMPSCGSCTRCLNACPTGALVAPGVLDANRCMSYLTIENRKAIPFELRSAIGRRVFGCDMCQEVCPWNKAETSKLTAESQHSVLDLKNILEMDKETFRECFRQSPIWRATPEGLARNAAVVMGNLRDPAALVYTRKMAQQHPSPLVREHLFWANSTLNV